MSGLLPTPGATPDSGTLPPATGTTGIPGATPATPTTTPDARIAELEHALKNATEERDRHRKKLSTYEQKEVEAQQAALSDVEKATKATQAAEAKAKAYQERVINAEVKLQAQALGIIDPDIAALAIASQLTYGDDGMPNNVEAALKELVKNKPYLVRPADPSPTQTAHNGAPNLPSMNPGRTTIPAPGALKPGQIPRLSDVFKRPS